MSRQFTTADWSMGYTSPVGGPGTARRFDGSAVEIPGNDQPWWEAHLASSISAGLGDLRWYAADGDGTLRYGVWGLYEGGSVSIRLSTGFERRETERITDEVLANVQVRVTPLRLGLWVVESPPKWFRGRRAWALNRPPFSTGDPWFDEHAGCWAWDCSEGPEALRTALAPALPVVREVLESQPGAIVTNNTISAWIRHTEMPDRLPRLLSLAQSFAG